MSGVSQVRAAGIGEGAVSMNAVLVDIIGAHQPLIVESVLHAAGNMNGVGRFVRGANHISRGRVAAGQAAGADQRSNCPGLQ